MKNMKRDGVTFEFVVATTARTAGSLERQGNIVGIHTKDAAIGETAVLQLIGAFTGIPKVSTDVWAVGDPLYFDVANAGSGTSTARLTKTLGAAGVNPFAGVADAAAANPTSTGDFILGRGSPMTVST